MVKKLSRSSRLVAAGLITAASLPAQAATLGAYAGIAIDWNTLSISALDGSGGSICGDVASCVGNVLSWDVTPSGNVKQFDRSKTEATGASADVDQVRGWNAGTSALSSSSDATAYAVTGVVPLVWISDGLGALAMAFEGSTETEAEALARRWGDFTALLDATITFSVDFLYAGEADSGNESEGRAGLSLSRLSGGSIEDLFRVQFGDGFESGGGTLTLSRWFDAGDHARLSAEVRAEAEASPVPVPPSVWLMGGALIGLVGIARRRGT